MDEPRVPERIYIDDRAREPVRRFARLTATGVLAMAIASTLQPQAEAQQADSAARNAPATAATPTPQTDTASKFDVNVTAQTYTVYVTPSGGTKTLVGANFAFRVAAATLNNVAQYSAAGSHSLCSFTLPEAVAEIGRAHV